MLLGDLIARLDDDAVAAETLMALDDLVLAQQAQDAAASADLDPGAYVAMTVRRYLNQAPPDEWTTLMGAIDRSDDPGSALIKRSLTFILDHERRHAQWATAEHAATAKAPRAAGEGEPATE